MANEKRDGIEPVPREVQRSDPPGYQVDTVNVRKVWMMVGILLLAVLVSCGGIALMLDRLEARHAELQPPMSALERERLLPPEPRLEATPRLDGMRYRQQAEQQLDSYGWVDRENGLAHIPLKQAQQLMLQRGWPENYAGQPGEQHAR